MGWFSSKGGDFVRSVKNGDIQAVKAALATGVDPNTRAWSNTPVLALAAGNGQAEIVHVLLGAGADLHHFDAKGENALVHAAANGRVDAVRELIGAGADPNACNRDGKTAAIAMADGIVLPSTPAHGDIVREMVAAGLDVHARDKNHRPTLIAAVSGRSLDMVRALLDGGADPNVRHVAATPLETAACVGHGPIIDALLQAGADHSVPGTNGGTPLSWAAGFNDAKPNMADPIARVEAVRVLIGAGADVNARSPKEDISALMLAAARNRVEIIKLLVAAGAELDATSGIVPEIDWMSDITALMYAAAMNGKEAAIVLIELGADPNLKMSNGWTASKIAATSGHLRTSVAIDQATRAGKVLIENPIS